MRVNRKMLAVLIISICARLCESVPVIKVATLEEGAPAEYVYVYSDRPPNQRIFWTSIGDFIMGTDFFPIEVNVPDIINNVVSGASGAVGGALQRIPIINRISSAVQPRPKQYYLLLPLHQNRPEVFNTLSNIFPAYP